MVTDESLITSMCRKVIEENPKIVLKHLKKPEKPRHFQRLMKILEEEGNGKLHMKTVATCLQKLLDEQQLKP
jgi:Asp-tRNA(Asn)/Glu-tRNA(Gln) amidotransferase B subunit